MQWGDDALPFDLSPVSSIEFRFHETWMNLIALGIVLPVAVISNRMLIAAYHSQEGTHDLVRTYSWRYFNFYVPVLAVLNTVIILGWTKSFHHLCHLVTMAQILVFTTLQWEITGAWFEGRPWTRVFAKTLQYGSLLLNVAIMVIDNMVLGGEDGGCDEHAKLAFLPTFAVLAHIAYHLFRAHHVAQAFVCVCFFGILLSFYVNPKYELPLHELLPANMDPNMGPSSKKLATITVLDSVTFFVLMRWLFNVRSEREEELGPGNLLQATLRENDPDEEGQ
mmetsp:Transcript_24969/g.48771  ORF Transcript_24969/g.48771 Transcript_24969/m.48771 type:complete len:279 (-) Transcript_24969:352-1188(-)